ncbi:MAG: transposase domain-containing protein [Propionivibrio sp.]|nr:transposase domain-containing protein [Propionivibrio sp.]
MEPHAWLADTFEKLLTWPYRQIDELLPLRPITTT